MSLKALNIPTIDFVGKRMYAVILSTVLIALSVFSLSTNGLK